MALVLRWDAQAGRDVDTVVVEKHTRHLVPAVQRGFDEVIGRIRRLVRIWALTDDYSDLQRSAP